MVCSPPIGKGRSSWALFQSCSARNRWRGTFLMAASTRASRMPRERIWYSTISRRARSQDFSVLLLNTDSLLGLRPQFPGLKLLQAGVIGQIQLQRCNRNEILGQRLMVGAGHPQKTQLITAYPEVLFPPGVGLLDDNVLKAPPALAGDLNPLHLLPGEIGHVYIK